MQIEHYKKLKLPPQYTKMFRDKEVWDGLKVLMANCHEQSNGAICHSSPVKPVPLKVFRAWSAGCSTGEEAYSLASTLDGLFKLYRVHWKVYATDIVMPFPDHADRIRFKYHNLVEDEPLAYMDIILCRNVLMFFTHEYQEIICKKLYTSLRTGGYLVLGKAESIRGEVIDQFDVVDHRLKIYKKK